MEILTFSSGSHFRDWLEENHSVSDGIWLRIFKKDSGIATVTYVEALDEALCFGWIDGQRKPFDADSWVQRFTPRRKRSNWSRVNTEHAERLTASGLMMPAGQREVDAAKLDGRWEAAYDSFSNAVIPDDFLEQIARVPAAREFFETLNKTNLYSIAYRLQTAKRPETREKRIREIIAKLERGEKFH